MCVIAPLPPILSYPKAASISYERGGTGRRVEVRLPLHRLMPGTRPCAVPFSWGTPDLGFVAVTSAIRPYFLIVMR